MQTGSDDRRSHGEGSLGAERASLRVLVVDDEKTIADSLVMILRVSGYDARAVYSGEAAIALLGTFVPDVTIADVLMGSINGIELAAYFAEHVPECTVVLFSGQAETQALLDEPEARRMGFPVYAKPVHPEVLLELVEGEAARRGQGTQKVPPSNDHGLPGSSNVLAFRAPKKS
jgi:DNA-binding NtrC family response regulator